MSNHLQHIVLSYFKTLSIGPTELTRRRLKEGKFLLRGWQVSCKICSVTESRQILLQIPIIQFPGQCNLVTPSKNTLIISLPSS